jgi:Na+/proline symporter
METNNINQEPENKQDQIAEYHDEIKHFELEGYQQKVRKARNALFIAAGALALGFFISLAQSGEAFIGDLLIVFGPLIVAFILLGFWTKKKPYTAIILGLILFFGFWIGFSILEPRNIYSGIIIKIFVIVALFSAINDAKELQKAIEEKNNS